MIVIDSSVWIDYFTGKPTPATDKLDSLLGVEHELALLHSDKDFQPFHEHLKLRSDLPGPQ